MTQPRKAASKEQLLCFSVGDKPFSVPAAAVADVRRVPPMMRVPNGPASLAGLMNHNGVAIAVVRLSAILGQPSNSGTEARVIVYDASPPVGLLVDRVIGLEASAAGARGARRLDPDELLAREYIAGPAVTKVRMGFVEARSSAPEAQVALLAFRIAGQRYALPLAAVTEIFVLPEAVAALPGSAGSTLGMTQFRDGVLPLISLAALLGLTEAGGRRHVLVTRLGTTVAGLVAGAIDGVVRVPETSIDEVPAILQRGEGDAEIEAIARSGDQSLISILSPAKLMRNRDVEQAVEGSNAGTTIMPDQTSDAAVLQFVVFRLGDEAYGLPIGAVDEIVALAEKLTRLPTAPVFVAGVMNLRGRALPLIDLRQRFGSAETGKRGRVIVVTAGEVQTGFIVDGVSDILRVAATDVTAAPKMPGDGVRVFDRVAPTADGMVMIVEPKELLDRAERDMLRAFSPTDGSESTP